MLALLSRQPGGPETLVLDTVAEPRPKAGEVLLAVRACGVNYPDALIIEDRYQFKPERPFSPGGEVSGVVEAVGEGVSFLKVGDRVIGSCGWGGMAEKLAIAADRCIPMPDAMPFDEAAAFVMTYGTSYHALKDRAQLKPGETLLVLGAAGGVGLAAVELGKAMGAKVIAAASSEEKAALARKHGADESLVYPPGPFDKDGAKALAEGFKAACGPDGADVIYDPVGGDYSEAALRAIAWEGRLLVVGFPAGIPKLPLNLPLLKSCQIVGVFWGAFARRDPKANAANLRELLDLYDRGTIRPVISERVPLARAGEAIAALSARRALGKIVVTMEGAEAR
ncbi:NADPH:quinone oxidoreductase family protein [Microvirga arsenatis]|uniref:Zinc-binding dehydrogenase n=1 Tax=Microvirga arsenatis TaxID=2692265 RepID=A0ABW9YTS1_9HYPH|nr:NADPH:quinone oxidoreductase family protein [Microvirga arsenatis]NBJ09592.1 zinc-binding dehydrogenase [Microvirga arsenatis]NBJ23549.1 zinc-binding dehydrogenase [Microvirga arsenatis]